MSTLAEVLKDSQMRGSIPKKSSSQSAPISIQKCDFCGKEYKLSVNQYSGYKVYQPDCDCPHRNYIRREQKEKGVDVIARIVKIKFKSGIGRRFYHKTFSNYNGNDVAKNDCIAWARNYHENYMTGNGLLLTGTVGTGKTHLLAAIIDYIARIKKDLNKNKIVYRTAPSLLNEIRNSYENKDFEEVTDNFKNCHLLIIDDLGAEKTTDWVLDIFFEIIDSRYSDLRPVIIASNLTDIEIKQKYDERIMSRLYEMNKGIELTGKDYRTNQK